MEQVGTAFVQIIPSMRGFHQSIGRDLRRNMGQVGEQSGKTFTQSMLGSVNRGMSRVGGAISRTTRSIAQAAQAIAPIDRSVKGLTAGLRGTRLETTGLAGALNSMGLRAQTAITLARDGALNLAAGFADSQAAASALTGAMGTLGGLARSAVEPVIAGVQNLVAGFQDSEAAASAFTGRMGTLGGHLRSAVQPGITAIQNLAAGFNDSQAAASAFTGRVGTLGGLARSAVQPLVTGAQNLAAGFQDSQAAASAFTGGLGSLGGVGARALQAVTAPVRGLTAGLRGTHSEATGLAGAFNTAGLAANTAFTHGRAQVGLFSAGLKGVGVSASESNSWMYRLGQTTTSTLSKVGPGFRSAGEAITSAGSKVRQWAQETTSQVGGLGGAFSRMGAMGAAAIAGLGFGALAGQVAQVAMSASTTEAQLTALYGAAGGGAAEVSAVMEGMNQKFRGLDMSVMRQGAVSLAYMGLQGDEAVGVLERMEKATTAVGSGAVGMDRAFAALTKGVNAGKFQMVELNQISDAGIPIYDALADVLGVDIPTAQKMATDGAIGLEEVLQALSGDHGTWFPALLEGADNIGKTFSGAWLTVKNSIVNGFAEQVVPLFDNAAPVMSNFAGLVETGFAKLPDLLDRVKQYLVDFGIVDAVTRFVDGVKAFASEASPAVRTFAETFSGTLGVAIGGVLLALGPLGDAFSKLSEWMGENQEIVELLGAALGGAAAAITVVAIAKGVWAAVTWGLAAAINATGIPLLIFAIAALVAGVIYAYNNFEGFKNVVDNVAGAIKTAALWIWDNGLKPAFDGIVAGAKVVGGWCVWLWEKAIKPAWESIVDGALWLWGHIENVWGWITDAWQTLSDLFNNPPTFSEIGDALKTVASDVTTWLGEKAAEVGEWFKGLPAMLWEGLVAAGEGLRDWYTETFDPEQLQELGQEIANRLIEGLGNLAEKARTKLGEAKDAIIEWAEELPGAVRERIDGMADAVSEWAEELPDLLREKLNETVDTVREWASSIPDRITEWIDTGAAAEWVDSLKETVKERAKEITDEVIEWAKQLPDHIKTAIDNAAQIKDWIVEWGPKILLGLIAVVLFLALAIPGLLATLASAVLFVLGVILWELGKWLLEKATELMVSVRDAIKAKVDDTVAGFRELRDQAVARVVELRDRVVGFFNNLRDQTVARATNLRDRVVSFFQGMRERAVNAVTNLRDRATTVMTNARDWIVERATRMRDRVVSPMETLRDKVVEAFDKAQAGIKTAWEKVEEITRKPVAFVVNTVYNDGIRGVWNKVADLVDMDTLPKIYGFATGGVLPGYTPGRDVHTFISPTGGGLELSGGEAIMRPEWTRAVGPGFVHQMNAAARAGGVSGVRSAMGFARGGIIPTQAFNEGGIWDKISSFGSKLSDIFDGDGLAGAARIVLDPLIETMGGKFTEGRWSEALVAVPSAIIDKLMTWFTDVVGKMLGGDGKKIADIASSYLGVSGNPNQFTRAFGMNGLPWCAMFVSEVIKEAKAQEAYNNIRSAAVASFANSSMSSVSSVGATRPGDLAVYKGKGPGNWGHINIIANDSGGTVGGNESNGVRWSSGYSNRAAKFMRPKFATGGIWQQNLAETSDALTHPLTRLLRAGEDTHLYDSGGWLQPGLTAVHNATGRPEAVLTPSQSDALVRIASQRRRGGEGGHTFNVYETRNARTTAKSTVTALRDHEALHPVP